MIRLEQLRYDAGLTFEQLAERVPGVTARTIARIESGGTRRPWPRTAKALAGYFDVTPTQLLERVPDEPAAASPTANVPIEAA